jgi:hypothetical protein
MFGSQLPALPPGRLSSVFVIVVLLLQVGLTVLQYLVWVVQANIAAAQGGTGAHSNESLSHSSI